MTLWHTSGRFLLAALGLCPFALGCSHAAPEDRHRLALLQERYGGKYECALESDLYVRARQRQPLPIDRRELENIFTAFWFDRGAYRSDSRFVYLNVYDSSGGWQTQVYWDSAHRRVVFEHGREHY